VAGSPPTSVGGGRHRSAGTGQRQGRAVGGEGAQLGRARLGQARAARAGSRARLERDAGGERRGATARPTTSVGHPGVCDQTAATPGPAVSRTWLPSRPAGRAAASPRTPRRRWRAFSAEKVKTPLSSPTTWYDRLAATPAGRRPTSGTSRPGLRPAAAASGAACGRRRRSARRRRRREVGQRTRSSVLTSSGATCSVRKIGSQSLAAAHAGAGQDDGEGERRGGRAAQQRRAAAGAAGRRGPGGQRRGQARPGSRGGRRPRRRGAQRGPDGRGVLVRGGQGRRGRRGSLRRAAGRRRRPGRLVRRGGAAPRQSDDAWRSKLLPQADRHVAPWCRRCRGTGRAPPPPRRSSGPLCRSTRATACLWGSGPARPHPAAFLEGHHRLGDVGGHVSSAAAALSSRDARRRPSGSG
jgi:hypothetical protein